jgi:membrane AbrB-like protein
MSRTVPDRLRAVAREFHPSRFPYLKFLAAIALGLVGAFLFVRWRMPLPWMLGPMAVCTVAALLRAPIAMPGIVRPPMTMVIGVMLGSGFTPAVLGHIASWAPTLAGLFLFVVVSGAACVLYFRFIAKLDPATAYFAGMPGGLIEMVILGEQKGADARTIALVHSARILLIVMTLPFIVQYMSGTMIGERPQAGLSIARTPLVNEVWLIATAMVGAWLGALLRLPAQFLLGPMIASTVVHALGWTDFKPPVEIVNGAQLVLGAMIGCRFAGTPPKEVIRILGLSLGSTMILLALTGLFALGVSRISAYGVIPLVLAYSPGGLAEMSLVALALQIEVAFVAAHHIVRVFFVMLCAGPAFALLRRWT